MIAVLALLAWAYLLQWHGRFWQSGPELGPAVPRATPDVAVVVPARDEAATIAASLGSLLAQDYAGQFRVVLVDDGSTDGTGDLACALPGADRLQVIAGSPRPAGVHVRPPLLLAKSPPLCAPASSKSTSATYAKAPTWCSSRALPAAAHDAPERS